MGLLVRQTYLKFFQDVKEVLFFIQITEDVPGIDVIQHREHVLVGHFHCDTDVSLEFPLGKH